MASVTRPSRVMMAVMPMTRFKHWFDSLTTGNGNCCSFAGGLSISDVEWDTEDGHYRVLLHGEWINVPNSSVVTEPNRYGPAVVWPYMDTDGNIYIRCFLGR